MSEEIRNLEPKEIWSNFANLNAVPRPSKKEEQVRAFIIAFAESHGLSYKQDAIGNILIDKPATPGMENRRKVILQSHLDMVCQKNADVDFDFETQGIDMYIDGEWVKARGTTLGADNGIGVATALATLASTEVAHPPLEALFTTDEEAGMTGAHHLQPNFLTGEILMNLDTEDDDELSIGCAGGIDLDLTWQYDEEAPAEDTRALHIMVSGLSGGHSGMDIILGRGNANKILTRFLIALNGIDGISISNFEGGGLRNAIPREAHATMVIPATEFDAVQTLLLDYEQIIKSEFATTDPNFKLTLTEGDSIPSMVMAQKSYRQFKWAMQGTHDGIQRMSPDVPNLVETSNNLANVVLANGNLSLCSLQRSDREGAKVDMANTVAGPWELIGASIQFSGSYPGWKLDPNAPMLGMMKDLYEELFNESPRVIACHAGLECGLLGQHYPEIEMISFGPTIRDPHSPDEKVNIASVGKFWHYFQEALKRIPVKS
jgi:dipeptidase D